MADAIEPLRFRDGLPPDADTGHYFGFGEAGEVYALAWDEVAEAWSAAGHRDGRPVSLLLRDGQSVVARSLAAPIAALPREAPPAPAAPASRRAR